MSAYSSLILLIIIMIASISVVAYSNYMVEKAKKTTLKVEKMKIYAEELEDVVLTLDSICEKRVIPKLINDAIIEHYLAMIDIAPQAGYLQAGLSNAQARAEAMSDNFMPRKINRACQSDAQIARYHAYLNEAQLILKQQKHEGKITAQDLEEMTLDIQWLKLQVTVITHIVQGHIAYTKQEASSARSFYKKAQNELLSSPHPDKRRQQMIDQLSAILSDKRRSLDEELMPETESNPDEQTDSNIDPPSNAAPQAVSQEDASLSADKS